MRNRFLLSSLLFLFLSKSALSNKPDLKQYFDVLSYTISLKVQPEKKMIFGSNLIQLRLLKTTSVISLDLFPQMLISSAIFENKSVPFSRDSNSFVLHFPYSLKKGDTISFTIHYSGKPIVAKKAPWDGGFVWSTDSSGNPWVGLACEGLGASCWLPCKDQWSDEPEKVNLKLVVPKGLIGVSNGKFVGSRNTSDAFTEFNWTVSSPINHYNISINIGNYTHLEDIFVNESGQRLTLDYYVLPYNVAKAKVHFQQVKRMLQSFEKVFGPYPFYEDGYKLVETPYWGMEHQSCVAYGNNYQNNKFGFDFIIVHESGHEWFANSITAADKADMWIHEGFTTYSECLYVEKQLGLPRAVNYIVGQKGNIKNNTPLIGPRGVNYNRTDNDLYYKGAWMLHTMRNVLDNDTLWFNTLKDLNEKFYHQIVSSKDIENFFIARTQYNFKPFFEQYLYHKKIPVIEYYLVQKDGLNELHYRLNADVKNLVLPVKVTLSKGKMDFLSFSRKWKIYDLPYSEEKDFLVDDKHFLVEANRIPNKQ